MTTEAQARFIRSLLAEKAPEVDPGAWMAANGICPGADNDLTTAGASAVIKALKDLAAPAAPAGASTVADIIPADATRVRSTNAYGGHCQACNTYRGANQARAAQVAGKWLVYCNQGGCEAVEATTEAAPAAGLDLTPLSKYCTNGSIYVAVPAGDTRLKLQIDFPTKGKWAGWVFVKDGAAYGEGRRYGSQKPGGVYRGGVVEALAAIVADPMAALQEYARLTGACGICNRHLEDAISVHNGIGPVCAEKLGIVREPVPAEG